MANRNQSIKDMVNEEMDELFKQVIIVDVHNKRDVLIETLDLPYVETTLVLD